MDALLKLLREILPWMRELVIALLSYRKGHSDAEKSARSAKEVEDAAALRRVLGAARADGMSRDDVISELQRRGMYRLPSKSTDGE